MSAGYTTLVIGSRGLRGVDTESVETTLDLPTDDDKIRAFNHDVY